MMPAAGASSPGLPQATHGAGVYLSVLAAIMRGERAQVFRAGIRAELPIALGVVPFGMIYGVLALSAGLSPALAQAMSAIVFAGSAQFIGTQLIATSTPAVVLLLTTLIVNLRHLLYSASVAPYFRNLSPPWKAILAYLLTDEAFAVSILHFKRDKGQQHLYHWYLLGAGLTLWLPWQISTALGIFLGAQVPAGWALDFTLALTFIGLLVPALTAAPEVAAALTAGVVAIVGAALPYRLGILLGALSGIAAGMIFNQFVARRISKTRSFVDRSD
jgi:4-azaleucine resistance transporter AzlC